jgi:hypothetical protein
MTWPHPFITIDQNQFRRADALAETADECRRERLHILIPDGAFQEFAKSERFFDTATRSLKDLAPYRNLIFMARPMKALIAEVLANGERSATLVHQGTTDYLRALLVDDRTIKNEVQALANGPLERLMSKALASWNGHRESKLLVQGLHNAFKRGMSVDRLATAGGGSLGMGVVH